MSEKDRPKSIITLSKERKARIARRKIMLKIEKMLLAGVTNHGEIAAAVGIKNKRTVLSYIHKIEEEWLETDKERTQYERGIRSRQFENIAHLALIEFEDSKRPIEERIIQEKVCDLCSGLGVRSDVELQGVECSDCAGTGEEEFLPGKFQTCEQCGGEGELLPPPPKCTVCQGTGVVSLETKKVKRSTGDPAYLKVAKDAFAEAGKVTGAYPGTNNMTALRLKQTVQGVGGEIEENTLELYKNVSDDTIIQGKLFLEQLKEEMKTGTKEKVDKHIFDAQFEPKEPLPEEFQTEKENE